MGCGRVGSDLAHRLEAAGHSVAVIDQTAAAFRRLGPHFAGRTVLGMGFDSDVLREAGIERADAFAAVSNGDNSNIIAARVVRETFGVDRVAARIYDSKRAEIYQRLGIPTVATVQWTADQMMRLIAPRGAEDGWRDPSGRVQIAQVPLSDRWFGRQLSLLESESGARAVLIDRLGRVEVPSSSMVVQDGDRITVSFLDERLADVEAVFGRGPRSES
jgi:trk system potassium uptake protein